MSPSRALDRCPDRLRLSQSVVGTLELTYKIKARLDAARPKRNPGHEALLMAELGATRAVERTAERALRQHIEQHQCQL